MNKKYKIELSQQQRQKLLELVKKGKASARVIRRAHTLLMAAEGKTDEVIARTLHTSVATIERTRKQCCRENLEIALSERPRSGKPRTIQGKAEAFLIATTCSNPPPGRERWTLKLLAARLVELELIESVSTNTVGRLLKKTN